MLLIVAVGIAIYSTAALSGVSGQRPEQGADAKFLRSTKRGHKALTLHSEVLLLPRCW